MLIYSQYFVILFHLECIWMALFNRTKPNELWRWFSQRKIDFPIKRRANSIRFRNKEWVHLLLKVPFPIQREINARYDRERDYFFIVIIISWFKQLDSFLLFNAKSFSTAWSEIQFSFEEVSNNVWNFMCDLHILHLAFYFLPVQFLFSSRKS